MQRFCQEIQAALAHLERAQQSVGGSGGPLSAHLARLIIADRQLRAVLDEEGRRLARVAALATETGRCERGTYTNA